MAAKRGEKPGNEQAYILTQCCSLVSSQVNILLEWCAHFSHKCAAAMVFHGLLAYDEA
jgi:hypothetical protein